MLDEFIFIFLYGALFMLGVFLAPFWATVAVKRARLINGRWTLRSDRYFVLSTAIAVLALGDTLQFGGRAWGNTEHGLSAILRDEQTGAVIGIGLCLVFFGKAMLVWLADLEREPPVWSWTKWGALITMLWAGTAIVIELVRMGM